MGNWCGGGGGGRLVGAEDRIELFLTGSTRSIERWKLWKRRWRDTSKPNRSIRRTGGISRPFPLPHRPIIHHNGLRLLQSEEEWQSRAISEPPKRGQVPRLRRQVLQTQVTRAARAHLSPPGMPFTVIESSIQTPNHQFSCTSTGHCAISSPPTTPCPI